MFYSTLSKTKNDALKRPMFFGQPVSVARYDQQKYEVFEELVERQLSFFWHPEETDTPHNRIDYANLSEHKKHIFISNPKYQTLSDSIQGRSPNAAFLPLVFIPELETQVETWSSSETIYSRSYIHIIRNIMNDPSVVFDDVVQNKYTIARAEGTACYYDDLIEYTQYYNLLGEGTHNVDGKLAAVSLCKLEEELYLCLMRVNVLETTRFYVSFACPFAFAERELMEGNAKIIKLIARDEALHLTSTQHMLDLVRAGADDSKIVEVANELQDKCFSLFKKAVEQEKEWAAYLFKDGSTIDLSKEILAQCVGCITSLHMQAAGLPAGFEGVTQSPIPWINARLSSGSVQAAPQEVEISSCPIGQIDSEVNTDDSGDFALQSDIRFYDQGRLNGVAEIFDFVSTPFQTAFPIQTSYMTLISAHDKAFQLQRGETLLEGLERTGHEIEYQCRSGYCGSYRVKILDGKASYDNSPLTLVAPGEILSCYCRVTEDIKLDCRECIKEPDLFDIGLFEDK